MYGGGADGRRYDERVQLVEMLGVVELDQVALCQYEQLAVARYLHTVRRAAELEAAYLAGARHVPLAQRLVVRYAEHVLGLVAQQALLDVGRVAGERDDRL